MHRSITRTCWTLVNHHNNFLEKDTLHNYIKPPLFIFVVYSGMSFLLLLLEEKDTVEIYVSTKVLFITAISTIALRCLVKIATNSLKDETRIQQSCKILIDILWILIVNIYTLTAETRSSYWNIIKFESDVFQI